MILLVLLISYSKGWSQLPNKVSFKCDLGTYLCMCNGCQKTINNIEYTATLHCNSEAQFKDFSQFQAIRLPNGYYAFRAFNGKYMAVCDGCIEGGTQTSFITFHESSSDHPWAQFKVTKLNNGRYAIWNIHARLYMARCNGCSPGASTPNQVTAHAGDAGPEWAQWEIIGINENNNSPRERVEERGISYVEYNDGGTIGKFVKTGQDKWTEYSKNGTFNFTPAQSDAYSVLLYDRSRELYIRLETRTKKIYTGPNANTTVLYEITYFK